MSQMRVSILVVLAAMAVGCGGGDPAKAPQKAEKAPRPSGQGVCALLMQDEVDEIFGTSIGAGTSESLDEHTELCSWPAGEDPAFLLQVSAKAENVSAAVNLGDGYRVEELSGMSGPAAVALEIPKGNDSFESVALMAMNASDKTVTLSPIGLGVHRQTDQFELLKKMVELVATRLSAPAG